MRAILRKNFHEFMAAYQPDILCLQETRAEREDVSLDFDGYQIYWNACKAKKGYSGTAAFTKLEPLSVRLGMDNVELDQEGRVITLEFTKCFLVGVYTPNSGSELKRLAYRTKLWDVAFLEYLKTIEAKKPVILCGDLNVAHQAIDLANPDANERSAGYTIEERQGFEALLAADFIDSFRVFHKEAERYSWWSYRTGARARNIGWRIDYFCLSKGLRAHLYSADIHADVLGSDHCPVSIKVDAELF